MCDMPHKTTYQKKGYINWNKKIMPYFEIVVKIVIQSSVTRNMNKSNKNQPVCWKVRPHCGFSTINKFNFVLRNRIRFEILSSMSEPQPDINLKPNSMTYIPIWKHEIYPDKNIKYSIGKQCWPTKLHLPCRTPVLHTSHQESVLQE